MDVIQKEKHIWMRLNNIEYLIILDKFRTFDDLYYMTDEVFFIENYSWSVEISLYFQY